MHRRAGLCLTTLITTARGLPRSAGPRRAALPFSSSSAARRAGRGSRATPQALPANPSLRSSMYFRRLPAAVASLVAGYGAWYAYSAAGVPGFQLAIPSFTSSQTDSVLVKRDVTVTSADELKPGAASGDGRIFKSTEGDGQRIVEMLSPEQATQKLRQLEQSFWVNRGRGVTRYDVVQVASNDPIEDDHAEKIIQVPHRLAGVEGQHSDWMFSGVFDGHAGWTTSATLRENLINYVARELNETYKSAPSGSPSPEAIDRAIVTGFTRLDDDIVNKAADKVLKSSSKLVAAEVLQPALSGSCALLSFYDSRSQLLRVACTGDSRAVLGRRCDSGKWTATALSEDQTGANPDEARRIRNEHPGEPDVVRDGRVFGLEPTRAFGDAMYKWSNEVAMKLHKMLWVRQPSPRFKTPPYVTAEPVITTTKIEPEKGDFVVLATDGMYEMLTNEEVVGLVGQWLETQASQSSSNSQFNKVWAKIFGQDSSPLPVERTEQGEAKEGRKRPSRRKQWQMNPDAKNRFVVKDNNVATHIVRNALGGSNEELVCSLLTLPYPTARRFRDDLTVQVIFFGNGESTGEVTVNVDATASQAPKAKL